MNSALSKLIVSFRAAKHKQNRRFALAVIFIPNFKEDGTMRRSNGTGAVVKLPGHRRKPYAARITSGKTITASGNVAPNLIIHCGFKISFILLKVTFSLANL